LTFKESDYYFITVDLIMNVSRMVVKEFLICCLKLS